MTEFMEMLGDALHWFLVEKEYDLILLMIVNAAIAVYCFADIAYRAFGS